MALSYLATELILQILHHVNPHDLISLRTTSIRFFQIIEQHERLLCRAIATYQGFGKALQLPQKVQSPQDTRHLQELRVLTQQWDRHQLVEQLLPVTLSCAQDGGRCPQNYRRSLELLWDYHNALCVESEGPGFQGHRSFVRSVTLEDLKSLIMIIGVCGDAIVQVFDFERPQSLSMEWFGEPCAAGIKSVRANPLSNLVIIKGLDFLATALVEKSPEVLDEVKDWTKRNTKSAMKRLFVEYLWKRKLAVMG